MHTHADHTHVHLSKDRSDLNYSHLIKCFDLKYNKWGFCSLNCCLILAQLKQNIFLPSVLKYLISGPTHIRCQTLVWISKQLCNPLKPFFHAVSELLITYLSSLMVSWIFLLVSSSDFPPDRKRGWVLVRKKIHEAIFKWPQRETVLSLVVMICGCRKCWDADSADPRMDCVAKQPPVGCFLYYNKWVKHWITVKSINTNTFLPPKVKHPPQWVSD